MRGAGKGISKLTFKMSSKLHNSQSVDFEIFGRRNLWLCQEMMRLSLIDAIGTRNNILFQNIQFSRVGDETDLEFARDDRNICLFTTSKLSFP